jgi:hypothetical protein
MTKYVLVALTNAVESKEQAFNDWYDGQHLPDVLDVPGVVSAQRFKLAETQRSPDPLPYRYMALYEIETDNLPAVLEIAKQRGGTPAMPRSDAVASDMSLWYFEPMGPKKTATKR